MLQLNRFFHLIKISCVSVASQLVHDVNGDNDKLGTCGWSSECDGTNGQKDEDELNVKIKKYKFKI